MSNRAAIRYAKAVLSLAQEQNNAEETYASMQVVASTIADNAELGAMLNSAVIKAQVKKSALLAIFEKNVNSLTTQLIDLLITNKRVEALEAVALNYIKMFDDASGKQVAYVTTATELSTALNKQVLAKVKELTGKEALLEASVDPAIIGGFILRVGDVQYDASIANKLSELKRSLNA